MAETVMFTPSKRTQGAQATYWIRLDKELVGSLSLRRVKKLRFKT